MPGPGQAQCQSQPPGGEGGASVGRRGEGSREPAHAGDSGQSRVTIRGPPLQGSGVLLTVRAHAEAAVGLSASV